ncbi:MAG: tryptophan--tRNA ligase [SAR116 cluster bacterium]|jgi:tryptophanyl-tRNA synthetase|nr:tryptophan--tRNA ligase [SAR116 cluster bacterium]RPG98826.1 MAG: tryptophan--tRNA ligase [Candidatus Puniceispirillum sp. TMED176]RZO31249.1 MAG: tryptophan--tRNA ligase [SAR116 cluster bacterium]|tara:strand:- start:2272 stop:3288 length:1017 start_codon:yes stop_codon:yes gene_type:complete
MPENRIFSGIQPTGNLHLGNYLGAIRNWVTLQDSFESIYCVVDLHAITVPQDPQQLRQSTREVTASLIAAGISPQRSILFNQSRVPQHSQLAWVFNCVARLGWLNRMTQFKEKAGKNRENATVGLFAYPTLMAADILAYRATHVPVGEDQKQHLELTRDIAQSFNMNYDVEFFPLPEPQIFGSATRVMSLRDGSSKMSKSEASDNSRINLTDDDELIAQKIRKAKTDPDALPSEAEGLAGRPEAQNLVGIYAALADSDVETVLRDFGGRGFGDFKPALAELAVAKLSPMGQEMRRLLANPGDIDAVLDDGAARAESIAAPIIEQVNEIVGFLGPGGNH